MRCYFAEGFGSQPMRNVENHSDSVQHHYSQGEILISHRGCTAHSTLILQFWTAQRPEISLFRLTIKWRSQIRVLQAKSSTSEWRLISLVRYFLFVLLSNILFHPDFVRHFHYKNFLSDCCFENLMKKMERWYRETRKDLNY